MKKYYHIMLFAQNSFANDIVSMACLSNGGIKDISLEDIATWLKMEKLKYPTLTDGLETTITGNKLMIDKDSKCIAEIEERQMFELSQNTTE